VLYIFRSAFRQCLLAAPAEISFPSVRLLMLSSEPVYDSDVSSWREHFPAAPVFINHLGSTEAGTYRRHVIERGTNVAPGIVPLGHPVLAKEVLLWGEDGEEVATGEVGEIVVRSRYLALGYWRRPDLTEASFIEPEGPDGARLFRTGDMGRLDDAGCLHSMGRKDDQVKILGRRVELAAVEAALLALDGIDEAVVVARADDEGQARLAAYVVCPGAAPDAAELRRRLAGRLAAAEMPSAVVPLDALPRLANGKPDRKDLASRELPCAAAAAADEPRDDVERRLTELLRGLLRRERLGITDDLFEQGADSLTAVEIVAAIETGFGVDLPTESLWTGATTIAALATAVRRELGLPAVAVPATAAPAPPPTVYAMPERAIDLADLGEAALLPVLKTLATVVPERQWRGIYAAASRAILPVRGGRRRALGESLKRRYADGETMAREVLQATQAGALERRLRLMNAPRRWTAEVELQGREHLDAALARGRVALLWLAPVTFAGVVALRGLRRAGYDVGMLTRPEHGLSGSRFGQRVLNPFIALEGEAEGVERIVMRGDGQAAIDRVRRRLRENRAVVIATVAHSDRPVALPLFEGEILIASGPPRMALATGAALLPVFARRSDGGGYEVEIVDELVAEGDGEALMREFVRRFEAYVLRHPGEWTKWTRG